MKRFITLLLGCSLTLAAGVQTGQAQFPNIKKPKVTVTVPKPRVPGIHKDANIRLNKNVTVFTPRHLNFSARPNPAIVSVTFNRDFRINGAVNWKGPHYEVYRIVPAPVARPDLVAREPQKRPPDRRRVVLLEGRVLVSGLGLR